MHWKNSGIPKPRASVRRAQQPSDTGTRAPSATSQTRANPGKLPHFQRIATHTGTGQHRRHSVIGPTNYQRVRLMKPRRRTRTPPSFSRTYGRSS